MVVFWRAIRVLPGEPDEEESDILDVHVTDTFNRFAKKASVFIDDPDGDKGALYPDFRAVRLDVRQNMSVPFADRFGGFVADRKRDGERLEVVLLSHDLWLRRRDVYRTYEDTPALTVLEDLITRYTPLVWDPTLITTSKNPTLTRRWQGERLTSVLDELLEILGAEEYGATNNQEFFMRPREASQSPRDFTEDEYTSYDFEENAEGRVNRLQLFYGEPEGLGDKNAGKGSVIVQDIEHQLQLQQQLGAARPVVIEATANYPEIQDEATAEEKANALLEGRQEIVTGELVTWDAFDVLPGMVAPVVIPESGIDAEFRVARIEYEWGADETRVVVAENVEGVVDVLVELAGEAHRVDARGADPEGPSALFEEFEVVGVVEADELVIEEVPVDTDAFLWGEARKGWGEPPAGGKWGDPRGAPVVVYP